MINQEENKYRCKHCDKIVIRQSNKSWIKSWCSKKNQYVHLIKIDKIILPHQIDYEAFKSRKNGLRLLNESLQFNQEDK